MPQAKKNEPAITRHRGDSARAEDDAQRLGRVTQALEAAQKDLASIGGTVGTGVRDLRRDVTKLLRDARRDLAKMRRAIQRDLDRLQKDVASAASSKAGATPTQSKSAGTRAPSRKGSTRASTKAGSKRAPANAGGTQRATAASRKATR